MANYEYGGQGYANQNNLSGKPILNVPSPRNDISQMPPVTTPTPPVSSAPAAGTPPSGARWSPRQSSGMATTPGRGGDSPYQVDTTYKRLNDALSIYDTFVPKGVLRTGTGNRVSVTGGDTQSADTWRHGSPGDARRAAAGGGSRSAGYSVGYTGPAIPMPEFKATPYPDAPNLNLPDYAPPEEDPTYERGKRQELMGNQAAQLRRMTRESMLASRSLSNPAARRQVARETMKGYGAALGNIYDVAAGKAMQAAAGKRKEDLAIYNVKHTQASAEVMEKYKADMNQMVQDWIATNEAAKMKYSAELADYQSQPLQARAGEATGQQAPQWKRIGYSLYRM